MKRARRRTERHAHRVHFRMDLADSTSLDAYLRFRRAQAPSQPAIDDGLDEHARFQGDYLDDTSDPCWWGVLWCDCAHCLGFTDEDAAAGRQFATFSFKPHAIRLEDAGFASSFFGALP